MSRSRSLHVWQEACLRHLNEKLDAGARDFLAVAGVGSGKTFFACHAALMMLANRQVTRIIIIAPTQRLITQWSRATSAVGIKLLELYGNSKLERGLPGDAQGYIVTYASVGYMPDLHEALANERPSLVIFDEIHHLGDDDHTDWGPKAKRAFGGVRFRLALSGTPFRSSQQPIPFVRYKDSEGGRVLDWDFNYGYGKSVVDGITRRVQFIPFDGPIEFNDGEKTYTHTFADYVDDRLVSGRLASANRPDTITGTPNLLLEKMFHDANRRLTDLRSAGHSDAGGLVIANSVEAAGKLVSLIHRISRQRPILVVNEEPGSLDRIDAFANSDARWLVSVKMVSEGVDIPRLRVCLYCSQITEELFFLQGPVGRIVRKPQDAKLGESYVYFPADERLVRIATSVEDEIERALKDRNARQHGGEDDLLPRTRLQWGLIDADGEEQDNIIASEGFMAEEIRAAEYLRAHHPMLESFSIRDVARMTREALSLPDRQARDIPQQTYSDELRDVARSVHLKVGQLHKLTGMPYDHINTELFGIIGVKTKGQASVSQLRKMEGLLDGRIAMAQNGR